MIIIKKSKEILWHLATISIYSMAYHLFLTQEKYNPEYLII